MSKNEDPQSQQQAASVEERAIKESAWQVIQQGAQVFGEVGGGSVGLAGTAKIVGGMLRPGGGAVSADGSGSNGSASSSSGDSGQE